MDNISFAGCYFKELIFLKFILNSQKGLFLGLSLAVSLRRYTVPSKGFPVVKTIAGCALPLAGFCFCLKKGANNALENLTKLRRKLFQNGEFVLFMSFSKKLNFCFR